MSKVREIAKLSEWDSPVFFFEVEHLCQHTSKRPFQPTDTVEDVLAWKEFQEKQVCLSCEAAYMSALPEGGAIVVYL